MKKLRFGMATQIFVGLILGILVGVIWFNDPRVATYLQPLGDLFLRLIKMIVIPIVISSLIVGIAGAGNGKQVGRLGAKTIVYFEVITTFAIIIGVLLANAFQPGVGVDIQSAQKTDINQYVETSEQQSEKTVADCSNKLLPIVSGRRHVSNHLFLRIIWARCRSYWRPWKACFTIF